MKEDKSAYNPSGVKIAFNEATHRYWSTFRSDTQVSGDQEHTVYYDSVTTLLKKISPPFDEQGMAERYAAKNGMTVPQVLAQWAITRDQAARFGTRVHAISEDCLKGQHPRHTPESERERLIMATAWAFATDLMRRNKLVVVEQIVFSTALRIAGQIDFAVKDNQGVLWIMDWKTNKEIRSSSPWGNTLMAPFTHLQDCELTKYGLQLSMYERILRHEGYITRAEKVNRAIIHLTDQGAKVIELPDMQAEVLDILLMRSMALPF